MTDCVVDTAVAIKLVVSESDSAIARSFLNESLSLGRPLLRLDLLLIEATNVVWKYQRRKVLTTTEAQVAVAALRIFPMVVEPADPLIDDALVLACTYKIGVYNALFVALVKKYDCDGITSDEPS